ncbi:MAG: DMT family transporter [Polaromonas sp.]|nr:DMT family transporter [Polaromonas sp.]
MKLTHGRAAALMLLVTLMWSIAGVVTRHLEAARSFEVTFWRSFFTALSLLVILPVAQGRQVFRTIRGGKGAFWLSGVCWAVMFTAFMVAMTLTTVANVLITMAAAPFVTAVIARFVLRQHILPRTWWAIAAAAGGIAWMYGAQLSVSGSHLIGMLLALLVPLAAGANWTVVQYSRMHGQDIDLVPAVMVGAMMSALLALPLALPLTATAHDMLLLAALGLFQLAIPCVLAVLCARALKAPEMALLALLEVIFGILLVWAGAGEAPGPRVLMGGAVVIGALVVNELVGWRQKS